MENELETKTRLTAKQKLFVEHYCGDCKFNATQAAIQAGYSKKTAYSIGNENLKKPEIMAAVAEQVTHKAERIDVEVTEIIQELRKLAFSGTELFHNRDKLRALELLGKYKDMFSERHILQTC